MDNWGLQTTDPNISLSITPPQIYRLEPEVMMGFPSSESPLSRGGHHFQVNHVNLSGVYPVSFWWFQTAIKIQVAAVRDGSYLGVGFGGPVQFCIDGVVVNQ